METLAFEQHKWPKKHDYLVEECEPLNIRWVLGYLTAYHAQYFLPWSPPSHPNLTIVPRRCGRIVRWFFQCPCCGRRCEDLFPAYLGDRDNLKCRICSNLIYASQRYGHRHPLRKKLTSRKRISRQHSVIRQERKMERAMKKHKTLTPPDGLPQSDKAGVEGKSWLDDFAERLGPTTFIVTHPRPEEPAIKPYPGFT